MFHWMRLFPTWKTMQDAGEKPWQQKKRGFYRSGWIFYSFPTHNYTFIPVLFLLLLGRPGLDLGPRGGVGHVGVLGAALVHGVVLGHPAVLHGGLLKGEIRKGFRWVVTCTVNSVRGHPRVSSQKKTYFVNLTRDGQWSNCRFCRCTCFVFI